MMSSNIKGVFKKTEIAVGTEKAERYTNMLRNDLKGASSEEDVRIATVKFLRELASEVGVQVKILNEKAVISGGRIDSLFEDIIIEFKKPSYFDSPAGITEAIEGRKQGGGLKEYMLSKACSESANIEDFKKYLSMKVGIGFDGKSFIFARYVFNISQEIDLTEYRQKLKVTPPAWFPTTLDGYFERTPKRDIKSGLRFLFLYLRSISPRRPLTPKMSLLDSGKAATTSKTIQGNLFSPS
jgi:hypothetical protein